MDPSPSTRPSLLVRIRDGADREAWLQFVDVYAPLVYRFARKRGLQDADAADLTQEVLQAVAAARFHYDPERGTFRGWLCGVARNKLHKFLARQQRLVSGADAQAVLDEQAAPEEEALWDQDYEQRLFDWAADQVRGSFHDSTWQAFWQVAVLGKSPRDVADQLQMSIGAVYIAKSRVLARLRKQIEDLQGRQDASP